MHKTSAVKRSIIKVIVQKVESIPDILEENTLYISDKEKMSMHLCMCGCGNKVINPLNKEYWSYIYDSYGISMYPSIGNWYFPCRSLYYINRGEILWR